MDDGVKTCMFHSISPLAKMAGEIEIQPGGGGLDLLPPPCCRAQADKARVGNNVGSSRYTLPLDDTIGEITIGATFSHSDSSRTNYIDRQALVPGFGAVLGTDLNPITSDLGIVPGYDLLNVNLDWRRVAGLPIDLSLFATNVTNERFFTFTTGLLPTIGSETAALNEPRMYGMRVRYLF